MDVAVLMEYLSLMDFHVLLTSYHNSFICIDGHLIEPKEQNTQQSPINGFNNVSHF